VCLRFTSSNPKVLSFKLHLKYKEIVGKGERTHMNTTNHKQLGFHLGLLAHDIQRKYWVGRWRK
jgi:hypothetical protein